MKLATSFVNCGVWYPEVILGIGSVKTMSGAGMEAERLK